MQGIKHDIGLKNNLVFVRDSILLNISLSDCMSRPVLPRSLQRKLIACLTGLVSIAILWPLIRPHQPPLPLLPPIFSLPGDWIHPDKSSARQSHIQANSPRRFHPLGSKVALGPSQTLVRSDGRWLRLTPLSSWTQSRFSLEIASEVSPTSIQATETRCLTKTGRFGRTKLHELMGWNEKPLTRVQRYWHLIVPVTNRSYSCIIIATNADNLFDEPSGFFELSSYLTKVATWPDPPGLNNRKPSTNQ